MIGFRGHRLYGKTDEVPGVFHVATRFFHVYFIPLFPQRSFVVLEKTSESLASESFKGVAIPLSWKSALVGWLQGAGVVGAIVLGFNSMGQASWLMAAAAVGCLALWIYLRNARRILLASYVRALELADVAQLDGWRRIRIRAHFEQLSEQEVHRLFQAEDARHLAAEAAEHGPSEARAAQGL